MGALILMRAGAQTCASLAHTITARSKTTRGKKIKTRFKKGSLPSSSSSFVEDAAFSKGKE